MTLSHFVHTIHTDHSVILFNTINSSIVELSPHYFHNGLLQIEQCTKEEIDYLVNEEFFIETKQAMERFLNKESEPEWLDIIISMTENCNLHCQYCYENNFSSQSVISFDTIDQILEYIRLVIDQHPSIQKINIDLIGGEPLLASKQIAHLVRQFNDNINKSVQYCLETNGTLFTKNVQRIFEDESVVVHVTLSLPSDHDKMRPYWNGLGTFETIISNLKNARHFFETDKHTLAIRYNVHMENVNQHDEFEEFIQKELPFKFIIDDAIVINYDYNTFKNTLSYDKYNKWNLEQHFRSAPSPYSDESFLLLPTQYMCCQGYSPYSIKVFSDGSLGICNAWMYGQRRGHIRDLINGVDKSTVFPEIKKVYPPDSDCIKCKNLFLCGGKRICRGDNQCDFIDFPIDDYLIKYVEGRQKNEHR